ncbi:MAG TPA: carbamoylphosphate synthase large subunit [Candidatus Faecousia faecipullorum]|nr:carbamoylphosphate synthase large subunit [Candidatus Faecousia faecipullorum]
MKNFVFISPNFPMTYWKFCRELCNNGIRVLGIGDSPYDDLMQELKDSLHEYYKVSSLENYDEVFRAVAFFTFKYGKIDWLESNNEYWLMQDAALRTEFNITTGPKNDDIDKIKYKSVMKKYYAKAGLPTARYHLVESLEDALDFAHMVGYPVVVKPDNGVGANNTFKLTCDGDVEWFIREKDEAVYIMEEFVKGYVQTYDAIIGSQGQPLFESGNITPNSLMDIVNDNGDCIYFLVKDLPENILDAGHRTVEAFGVKSRFVHLEFFVLYEDQEGLGKKGDVLGLEVNMRPSGGYTPDMYNYSQETDVYKIWADMVAFDWNTKGTGNHHYCAYYGRRDFRRYKLDDYEVMMKYGDKMVMHGRIPEALSGAMANQMYVANFDTEAEMMQYYQDISATYET